MELQVNGDLRIKTLEEEEKDTFFALIEKNMVHLIPWIRGIENIRHPNNALALIQDWASIFSMQEGFSLGVYFKGKLVGVVGLTSVVLGNHRTEISYWLDEDHQGKGIMTKSTLALMEYAFEELGFNRIEIHVATENIKSRAIPERLGFVQEGILREAEWVNGGFVDHAVYSMLKREWDELKKQKAKE